MSQLADSAGQPWSGRHFEPTTYPNDDGGPTPALLSALQGFQAGTVSAETVVDEVRVARLLIPLIARLGEAGTDDAGRPIDKSQELSIVSVAAPDGRTVLPVFTSVDAMAKWNPRARPVPADGRRIALAAASEETDLVVIDPTSDTEFVIRRPALWAMAQDQPWQPSHSSPEVFRALSASVESELGVLDVAIESGDPHARLSGPELVVRLTLADGLNQTELDDILARLARRWAANDTIATQVDSLRVQLARSLE